MLKINAVHRIKAKCLVAFLSISLCHIAGAEELVFFDDFDDGIIGDNWVFPDEGLDIFQGRVRFTNHAEIITTLQEFSGDVRVELDFEKSGTQTHTCWDLAVRLTSLGGVNGVLRFDYQGIDAIAIGTGFNAICDGAETTSVAGEAVNRGIAVLTYSDSMLEFSFMNDDGDVLDAQTVFVGDAGPYQLLLCIGAHTNSPRFVDNVKIYSLESLSADFDEDGDVDGTDFLAWQRGESSNPLSQSDLALWQAEFSLPVSGDFDNDNDVDGADFLYWQLNDGSESDLDLWQANFGSVTSSAAATSTGVPEPATGILLMLGMSAVLFRLDPRAEHGPGRTGGRKGPYTITITDVEEPPTVT